MGHAHGARKARTKRTALYKDAWRAIAGNGKRFAAIAVICAVGVMMMGALSSISNDLRAGMDEFLDTTSMHDLNIVSTLGFDDDDIAALRGVDGVAEAAGVRSSNAYTKIDDKQASATVTALNDRRIDEPYLTEGRLPESAHEIAVTGQYLTDSGKRIGDTLTFTVDESSTSTGTFEDGDYTIVGTVIDPNDIVNPTGPLALVTASKTVYPLFVDKQAVADDDAPYTSAAIRVDGANAMNTYDAPTSTAWPTCSRTSRESSPNANRRARTRSRTPSANPPSNSSMSRGRNSRPCRTATPPKRPPNRRSPKRNHSWTTSSMPCPPPHGSSATAASWQAGRT